MFKCSKCGNEYPTQYYFAVPDICTDCYNNMSEDERKELVNDMQETYQDLYDPYKKRIGFGFRLGVYIIDMIISGVLSFGLGSYFGVPNIFAEMMKGNFQIDPVVNFKYTLFSAIIGIIYALVELFFAASPAKMIFRLKIGNIEQGEASSVELLKRGLIKYSAGIFALISYSYFYFINYIPSAQFDPVGIVQLLISIAIIVGCFFALGQKKQAMHDMFAKTAVYRTKDIEETD